MLKRHCDDVGRDYAEIEKTVMGPVDIGADGEKTDEFVETLRGYADLGIQEYHGAPADYWTLTPLEILGERVIPAVADF